MKQRHQLSLFSVAIILSVITMLQCPVLAEGNLWDVSPLRQMEFPKMEIDVELDQPLKKGSFKVFHGEEYDGHKLTSQSKTWQKLGNQPVEVAVVWMNDSYIRKSPGKGRPDSLASERIDSILSKLSQSCQLKISIYAPVPVGKKGTPIRAVLPWQPYRKADLTKAINKTRRGGLDVPLLDVVDVAMKSFRSSKGKTPVRIVLMAGVNYHKKNSQDRETCETIIKEANTRNIHLYGVILPKQHLLQVPRSPEPTFLTLAAGTKGDVCQVKRYVSAKKNVAKRGMDPIVAHITTDHLARRYAVTWTDPRKFVKAVRSYSLLAKRADGTKCQMKVPVIINRKKLDEWDSIPDSSGPLVTIRQLGKVDPKLLQKPAQEAWQRAMREYAKTKPSAAKNQIRQEDPKLKNSIRKKVWMEIVQRLATDAEKKGEHANAESLLEEYSKVASSHDRLTEFWKRRAIASMKKGKYDEALTALSRIEVRQKKLTKEEKSLKAMCYSKWATSLGMSSPDACRKALSHARRAREQHDHPSYAKQERDIRRVLAGLYIDAGELLQAEEILSGETSSEMMSLKGRIDLLRIKSLGKKKVTKEVIQAMAVYLKKAVAKKAPVAEIAAAKITLATTRANFGLARAGKELAALDRTPTSKLLLAVQRINSMLTQAGVSITRCGKDSAKEQGKVLKARKARLEELVTGILIARSDISLDLRKRLQGFLHTKTANSSLVRAKSELIAKNYKAADEFYRAAFALNAAAFAGEHIDAWMRSRLAIGDYQGAFALLKMTMDAAPASITKERVAVATQIQEMAAWALLCQPLDQLLKNVPADEARKRVLKTLASPGQSHASIFYMDGDKIQVDATVAGTLSPVEKRAMIEWMRGTTTDGSHASLLLVGDKFIGVMAYRLHDAHSVRVFGIVPAGAMTNAAQSKAVTRLKKKELSANQRRKLWADVFEHARRNMIPVVADTLMRYSMVGDGSTSCLDCLDPAFGACDWIDYICVDAVDKKGNVKTVFELGDISSKPKLFLKRMRLGKTHDWNSKGTNAASNRMERVVGVRRGSKGAKRFLRVGGQIRP